jgi:hypothetical protein
LNPQRHLGFGVYSNNGNFVADTPNPKADSAEVDAVLKGFFEEFPYIKTWLDSVTQTPTKQRVNAKATLLRRAGKTLTTSGGVHNFLDKRHIRYSLIRMVVAWQEASSIEQWRENSDTMFYAPFLEDIRSPMGIWQPDLLLDQAWEVARNIGIPEVTDLCDGRSTAIIYLRNPSFYKVLGTATADSPALAMTLAILDAATQTI